MSPEQIEKLLGGYATGTLTEIEREALFQAAVSNQKLFDALAGEQALKELLDDPVSRAELLRKLASTRPAAMERFREWLRRPSPWAIAGGVAVAVVIGVLAIRPREPAAVKEPVLMAKRDVPALETPSTMPSPSASRPAMRDRMMAVRPGQPAAPAEAMKPKKEEESRPARDVTAEQAAAPTAVGTAVAMKRADEADSALTFRQQADGIVYRILRRQPDGIYTEADPATLFKSGDEIKIAVEPTINGFLTVTAPGKTPLFQADVRAGTWYQIPEGDPIRLGPPAGETRLALTLSQGPAKFLANVERKEASGAQPITLEILLRHR